MSEILPYFTLIERKKVPHEGAPQEPPTLAHCWLDALSILDEPYRTHFETIEGTLDDIGSENGPKFECFVSPANSFGIMDGGYDLALSRAINRNGNMWTLTDICQDAIKSRYRGYAPPGTCTLVPLPPDISGARNDFGVRFIAVVPTMRTPEDVSWAKDLVYDSVWNLLVEVARWNEEHPDERIQRILMTGLGTGSGHISYARFARQMALAVQHFIQGWGEHPRWKEVERRTEDISNSREL